VDYEVEHGEETTNTQGCVGRLVVKCGEKKGKTINGVTKDR
jgi:hypothetical protein